MAIVHNKGPNIQTWPCGSKNIRLAVGDNEVDVAQLTLLEAHPIFQDFVKRGLLRVTRNEEETKAQSKPVKPVEDNKKVEDEKEEEKPIEDLDQLSQRELIKRIAEMTDKDQLEALVKDHRTRVSEAAKHQLHNL